MDRVEAHHSNALMKISIVFLLMAMPFAAHAAETAPNKTPVTQCDSLPPSAAIEVFSRSDAIPLCRKVLRVLEGVTVDDLRTFENAAYPFSRYGYEAGDYAQIPQSLSILFGFVACTTNSRVGDQQST